MFGTPLDTGEPIKFQGPIIWRFRGDRAAGKRYMRRGAALMGMLENLMSFRGLEQGVLRRYLTPDVHIKCACCFGLRTVTITVQSGIGGAAVALRECFANTTVALAYVLDVVGVKAAPEGMECVAEPVCRTCIAPESYPINYYCTRGIRYTVAVCDGKGEYVLFASKVPTTDYTPYCPGDQVLVMLNRTSGLPEDALAAANANPMAKEPFTRRLAALPDECVSILPYPVSMLRFYEITS